MPGFTENSWKAISDKLSRHPDKYGFPRRTRNSIVIGSFNALKLGKATDSAKRWDFLTRFVSRYDLLAVQEVTDDLAGIQRLSDSLGSGYRLLISDTTGAIPGRKGLRERLAFLYRPSRIEFKELVSEITFDRSAVVSTLQDDIAIWHKFFNDFENTNKDRDRQGKRRIGLSSVAHPGFLTFIRNPHCASFSIKAKNGADAVDFLGINAHTLYGNSKEERRREFFALMTWLINRAKQSSRMYAKNMIVMADLNMMFDDAQNQFSDVVKLLHDLESNLLTGRNASRVNFPFLDVHPNRQSLFSTNARRNQTFDHVAFFIDKKERGLPFNTANRSAGTSAYDYGVFDFPELFAQAVHNKSFAELTATQRKSLLAKCKADVSDHMPIWTRLPIPGTS